MHRRMCVHGGMCVFLAAHVITLGPRRPVLSWMLEIFRAMAMRGPNTTCSNTHVVFENINTKQKGGLGFLSTFWYHKKSCSVSLMNRMFSQL